MTFLQNCQPRRKFLAQAAAISVAAALPTLLIGCGGAGVEEIASTSNLNVLALGAFGELRKPWNRSDTLVLLRADGTTTSYVGSYSELNVPTSAAAAEDGSFWVADTGNRRILHMSGALQPLGAVAEVAGQRFSRPTGVALLPDGRIAVSDQLLGQIAVVDASSGRGFWAGISADDHVGTGWVPHWETETDHRILESPRFIQIAPDGTLVVLDTSTARLVLLSSATGQAIGAIRLSGHPAGFALGPDGACYVCNRADKTVNRINLKTGRVDVVPTAPQGGPPTVAPDRAVWRTGSGPALSNLMVSYR